MAAGLLERLQAGVESMESVIQLTEQEEKIFQRLLDVVRHFNLDTKLRVAGGWVRDKLLGKQPTDIDIALDSSITGQEFSARVDEYLKLVGEEDQKGGTTVIQRNPDQSKHLETVKTKMFRKEIDFVNLRSEQYAESSRIPTVKTATPKVDAYRRDLTINSLFFNITDNCMEDFTLRGIDDLKKGLIATPLDSEDTFLDDPLRVLRAIRFAARLNFTLSYELKEAASDEKVKLELGRKISRERVGEEINHMMSGEFPVEAMSYIRDLRLFKVAFAFPEKCNPPVFNNCDRSCVSHIEAAWNLGISVHSDVSRPMLLDEQEKLYYLYSALFFPLRKMFYLKKKSKIAVTNYIIQESLKLPACVAKSVEDIHSASVRFGELVLLFESNVASGTLKEEVEDVYFDIPMDTWKRVCAGVILDEIKDLWRLALAISIISYPEADQNAVSQREDELLLHRRKEQYIRMERAITDLGLVGVWEWKPLVDGDVIMRVLQKPRGPLVGQWQKRVFRWKLAHPEGSVEDCIDWMTQSRQKVDPAPDGREGNMCTGFEGKMKATATPRTRRRVKGALTPSGQVYLTS